jgi:hypothetical protein
MHRSTHNDKETHIRKYCAHKYLHAALHGTGDGQSLPAVGDAGHGGGALERSGPGFVGAHLKRK